MPDLVGLRKTSLVDYPGKVAAVLFFPLCNLRCPWCHNPELLERSSARGDGFADIESALETIRRRASVLGGVVFSGGEPLLRPDIGELVARVKSLGLPVKIDTNGTVSDNLEKLFSKEATSPDYVALDLKTAPDRYRSFAHAGGTAESPGTALTRSASLLSASGISHEFRSLALPGGFFSASDLMALAPLVRTGPWFFSAFRPGNCLNPDWNAFSQSAPVNVRLLAEEAVRLGKDGRTR